MKQWKRGNRNGKKATLLFLGFCAFLCGCSPVVKEKLSDLNDLIRQPLEEYRQQFTAERGGLPTLQELLQGSTATAENSTAAKKEGVQTAENETQTAGNETVPVLADHTEKMTVSLFFLNEQGDELLQETRSIAKVPGIARQTVEALLDGPEQAEANGLFPAGTSLRDICITADGVCKLNFSREIQAIVSEKQEELVTLAIVKTLSQFPSIQSIQFMVEGNSVNSLSGNR